MGRPRALKPAFLALIVGALLMPAPPAEAAPPSNDDFDNATVIAGLPFKNAIDTREATTASDDPDCNQSGTTVWYSFTPAKNVHMTASTFGSNYGTTLSLYTGSRHALTQITCTAGSPSRVVWDLIGGTKYFFMVGSLFGGPGGDLVFRVVLPPPNDDFDSSTVVHQLPFSDATDTTAATSAGDDPSCGAGNAYTVWYAFTPSQDMRIDADTVGSDYPTGTCVYTGSRNALVWVQSRWGIQPRVQFEATAQITYFFEIVGVYTGGDLVFSIRPAPGPPNDDFDQATVVGALPFRDTLDTREALTQPPDDPDCGRGTNTVWYSFTPGETRRVVADTYGSNYQTLLSVYTGSRKNLTQIACGGPSIVLDAVKGTTYFFMIGAPGVGGDLIFSVDFPPPNDDFDGAIVIPGPPFDHSMDANHATWVEDDPWCRYGRCATLWYSLTPARNLHVVAATLGSNYNTYLCAYTGPRGGLTQVACNDDFEGPQSKIQFDGTAGTTYSFMVGGGGTEGANLKFSLRLSSAVTLAVSRTRVTYKSSLKVTAHLEEYVDATNKTLFLYVTPYGGSKRLVVSGTVDGSGNLSANVIMYKKATFVADWAGDDTYVPAVSPEKSVSVYVLLSARLLNYYGISGNYRLYHFTSNCPRRHTGCPTYAMAVTPNHAGLPAYFQLQLFVGRRWQTVLNFSARLNSKSNATVIFIYRDGSVINVPTRVRVTFYGDADHVGRTSAWAYFKVTR